MLNRTSAAASARGAAGGGLGLSGRL